MSPLYVYTAIQGGCISRYEKGGGGGKRGHYYLLALEDVGRLGVSRRHHGRLERSSEQRRRGSIGPPHARRHHYLLIQSGGCSGASLEGRVSLALPMGAHVVQPAMSHGEGLVAEQTVGSVLVAAHRP